ncbi:MAG: cyanophycinase [Bacteroidales bacterium]|jgi:cyanophycinase|nr:cyanophycinase [Bacteroidales bacterium]
MNYQKYLWLLFSFFIINSCTNEQSQELTSTEPAQGKLFIIGGGKRPVEMIRSMVSISGVDTSGFIIILPMSSTLPDTASFYGVKQFTDLGLKHVFAMNFTDSSDITPERIDSLKHASLIYISGGDQSRFMEVVEETPVYHAIHEAFNSGALIAGTSAGAAVMSAKMITGNEFKHPEYTGNFRTIEANNIEIAKGLGLLENVIIDQHFIRRMRMNRLISACLENPEETGIGIDESTAILVDNNLATVYGKSQVIVLRHKSAETKIVHGLLGAENLELNIYLPGDSFLLVPGF